MVGLGVTEAVGDATIVAVGGGVGLEVDVAVAWDWVGRNVGLATGVAVPPKAKGKAHAVETTAKIVMINKTCLSFIGYRRSLLFLWILV